MASNSAVAAKVKAMYGKCLTGEDFDNLLSNRTTGGICSYLKSQTSYSDVLADVQENDIHRGILEMKIMNKLESEYNRIYKFVDERQQVILDYWFMRREVNYLKHNIRNLFNKESKLSHMPDPEEFSDFFRNHTSIDTELCRNAESLEDFIAAVRNTIYEPFLKRTLAVNSDYFSIAMGLDALYYDTYWKETKKLSGREQSALQKLLGSEIDMLNIIWIYRGKKYFKFPDEMIYTYLLPPTYHLTEGAIKSMVGAKSVEEMVSAASSTKYKRMFRKLEDGFLIDENYRRDLYKTAKSVFRTSSDTIAGLVAYLDLKEIEILNIVRAIEGIRYGLNSEAIRKHIRI